MKKSIAAKSNLYSDIKLLIEQSRQNVAVVSFKNQNRTIDVKCENILNLKGGFKI